MADIRITMRHEVRETERRAPIVPADAALLVERGIALTVEHSPQRAFAISDYLDAGCAQAEAGSWIDAPPGEFVVGLKELPDEPAALGHRHVYFGHAYKGQRDARALLRRFAAGGGALLDMEYLTDSDGRRLAAFGYWAGYMGAALAVLHHRGRLALPLRPLPKESLDEALRASAAGAQPRVVVIGALGRCGRGARDALAVAGIEPTCWDVAETVSLDHAALLDHDILVNTVLVTGPTPPFVTAELLRSGPRRLSLVADVTCDVTSKHNVLPIYDSVTGWREPVRRLDDVGDPLGVIAIDNLPSLLPGEASVAFSAELTPHLLTLGEPGEPGKPGEPWQRCLRVFREACEANGLETESAHV
ncbi:saccharopine dehydrogenase [Embleya sp. NBC_00896]|uniref:saccharopine dehydrogenase n=1 Tax=Embleya sp. NBC_00896 TaxID=2975961 RepID=UPI002F90C465|nr:saccharopine dehydrogenase [Embleya sp. NBC_00896]